MTQKTSEEYSVAKFTEESIEDHIKLCYRPNYVKMHKIIMVGLTIRLQIVIKLLQPFRSGILGGWL